MKKYLIPVLLLIMFIPFMVYAEYGHYYIDNLELDQELECNDYLHPLTPDDLLSNNGNTIANVYHRFSTMYGRTFYFEDESSSYNNYSTNCNGACNEVQISCYPDGKERKWIIDKVEWNGNLEYANLYLKAVLKEPNLKITNQVNGLEKYAAKKDEILKYSVIVKNIGNGKSTSNIIITNIPKELFVIEDSISDNGIYDKDSNAITWNYELLESKGEKTFTYQSKVINEDIKEYVGNSSITSNQIQNEVLSGNTIVSIQKNDEINVPDTIKNPNTGVNSYIIIIGVLIVISTGVYIILKRKKDYLLK